MKSFKSGIRFPIIIAALMLGFLGGCKKSPDNGTPDPVVPLPKPKESLAKLDIGEIKNFILLNSPESGARVTGNVLATDSLGNLIAFKILDAKAVNMNVSSMKQLTSKYVFMTGFLEVTLSSGRIKRFNSFVIDVEGGEVYELNSPLAAILNKPAKHSPWANGEIQTDKNNNIYLQTSTGQLIQEITRYELKKTSDTTISVTSTAKNLIGESYMFNYHVLKSGDIIYTYKEGFTTTIWKYQTISGATKDISELVENKPLIINGIKYFDVALPQSSFVIIDSKDKPIFFIAGRQTGSTAERLQPFSIEIVNNQMTLSPLGQASFPMAHFPGGVQVGAQSPSILFSNYAHGMYYFKQGANHIFTNRWGTEPVSIWWSFNDQQLNLITAFLPYGPLDFTTHSSLLTNSSKNAFVTIKRDFYTINFNSLEFRKTANIDYQIFKTVYQGNEKVQFYGVSYTNAKKVLGEISETGVVKIIKEFANSSEVKEIIRLGKL